MKRFNAGVSRRYTVRVVKAIGERTPNERIANQILELKHRLVSNSIEKYWNDGPLDALPLRTPAENEGCQPKAWILWMQGEENAPDVVRACISSARRHLHDYEVVVVTDENIHLYVTFSAIVTQALTDGRISRTHFSDLVRFALLSEHGGLWVDATIFFVRAPQLTMSRSGFVTRRGMADSRQSNISRQRWSAYLIGGPVQLTAWAAVREFFDAYWENNRRLIDYHLVDYALDICARKDVGGFAVDLESIPPSNPGIHSMKESWSHRASAKVVEGVMGGGGDYYKLSWKVALRGLAFSQTNLAEIERS